MTTRVCVIRIFLATLEHILATNKGFGITFDYQIDNSYIGLPVGLRPRVTFGVQPPRGAHESQKFILTAFYIKYFSSFFPQYLNFIYL